MMHVIAGKYRGRRIETLKSKTLRPTQGKTREALFNILMHGQFQDILKDSTVLDLFCGCGSFAIESLSRGAAHVVCVDIASEHLAITKQNIANLHALEQATFLRADSSKVPPATKACDIIFIDPPYHSNLAQSSLITALNQGWLAPHAIAVLETDVKDKQSAIEGFEELVNRHYGKSNIRILRRI